MSIGGKAIGTSWWTAPDFSKARVAVVGDAMIDRWVYGHVRPSPEAPVLVHVQERVEERPGGAANVVENLRALGCDASLHSAPMRRTVKTRYVCGHQVFRADCEDAGPIDSVTENGIFDMATGRAPGVMVLSDYAKGVVSYDLAQRLIRWCQRQYVPVIVDPKGDDWSKYHGATILTPNKAELAAMKGPLHYASRYVLETKGAEGMTLHSLDCPSIDIPATAREVRDVTGAGDTVVAALAAALAAGQDPETAARIANMAAGVVVGKAGTATCSMLELEGEAAHVHAVVEAML